MAIEYHYRNFLIHFMKMLCFKPTMFNIHLLKNVEEVCKKRKFKMQVVLMYLQISGMFRP